MNEIAAFAELVNAPNFTLDAASAILAAAVRPPVDVERVLANLDALALRCAPGDFDDLRRVLFEEAGFRGNVARYGDPENSLIDSVLERGLGIPISLSIVMIEVGRRRGITIDPISMPGHFLVQHRDSRVFCDPFGAGELLDASGCRTRHDELFGGRRTFHPRELEPVAGPVVLARVLNNLEQSKLGTDVPTLAKLLTLHAVLPSLPAGEHLALATRFATIGRFAAAGAAADRAAALLEGDEHVVARQAAAQYWAVTN